MTDTTRITLKVRKNDTLLALGNLQVSLSPHLRNLLMETLRRVPAEQIDLGSYSGNETRTLLAMGVPTSE